nr:MAG TPA: hypothetical protein [Caudoviricetes sp.]
MIVVNCSRLDGNQKISIWRHIHISPLLCVVFAQSLRWAPFLHSNYFVTLR